MSNQESVLQMCLQTDLMEAVLQLSFLLPRPVKLPTKDCYHSKKQTKASLFWTH